MEDVIDETTEMPGETASEEPNGWAAFWEFTKTLSLVVLIAVLIRLWLVQPFVVDGQSMEPAFHNQEYILVDKVSYRFTPPSRGNVVVFHPHGSQENFIKRVVGLPGERIEIHGNTVSVDGSLLEEDYLTNFRTNNFASDTHLERLLADNEYFVLGDNRDHSKDSRDPSIGPIVNEQIVGKAWIVLFPLENFSFVEVPDYPSGTVQETQAVVSEPSTDDTAALAIRE